MTVGMLLATILLVLTFSGVLSGAWERLGIRPRTAGAWLLAMLAALLMPDVRLGAARDAPVQLDGAARRAGRSGRVGGSPRGRAAVDGRGAAVRKRIHRAGGNCAPNRHFPADPAGRERGTPRMRKLLTLLLLLMMMLTSSAMAAEKSAYRLADEQGTLLAWLDVPPAVGDVLLTADGTRHRVIAVEGQQAVLREDGTETLPDVPWSARETAQPVTSAVRTIGLMGDAALVRDLREGLANQGAPLVTVNPEQADFPLTVARDEISNSAEYDTLLSGEKAAKIRLIVRRGGDNEALMKDFALSVKAGLDHTAPTLIRDVYFAANAQEPLRMLWGARETEPIRLQNTILPLAQVISNALEPHDTAGGISGSEDVPEHSAVTGLIFAGGLLLAGVVGYGLLLTGGRRHGKKI